MTEEQVDEIVDSFLDVSSLDEVVLISEPAAQEGLTDGTTSTDKVVFDDTNDPIAESEEPAPADVVTYTNPDTTEFVPVNYTFDSNNNFINLDANVDNEEIIDASDEDPYQ